MTHTEERQVTELTQRLAEAEATIAALLSGEIDAVVDAENSDAGSAGQSAGCAASRARPGAALPDAPEIILLAVGLDGRITLVNRYACSILGWTADELMGRDWVDTCLPVRIRDDMKAKLHDLTAGEFTVLENPILTKSGDERLIGWRNTVLHDDEGNVTGVLSSGSDITESREVETALLKTTADLRDHTKLLEEHAAALLKSEERTTYALRAARMGLWELDMATGELTWSPTMAPLFGLRPDQALTDR